MRDGHRDQARASQVGIAATGSTVVVVAIVVSSIGDQSALGAPAYWAWILTGLQVVALRTATTGRPWGWLLGASVQFPWIAYALVTTQLGFVPGCILSAAVQALGYLRQSSSRPKFGEATYA